MQAGQLEIDCRQALQDLRGALIELYATMGIEADAPQIAARRFDLNKNLTWKISRIMTAEDALTAIQHLPGPGGIDILLTTLFAAGASEQAVEHVRACVRAFDEVVVRHAGDRADLDLILDSMGLSGESGMDASREMAFRGNSGVWGIQARVRTTMGVVVPSSSGADQVDIAMVGGFAGLRLLRPTVRWRLFRFQAYTDDGKLKMGLRREPLDENARVGDVYLLGKYCSGNMPAIEPARTEKYHDYFLPKGTVGNTGAFDCFFGDIVRGLPRFATPGDEYGDFSSTITMPVETMIFDVIVHRDIKMVAAPSVLIYGRSDGGADDVVSRTPESLLPIDLRCVELAGRAPAVSISAVPKYGELVQSVYASLGHKPSDFRGYRVSVKHPPMNSSVVMRWPLEPRP